MSQDAGTLQVTIALMGADQFDSATQQINSDLQSISQNAEQASGSASGGGIAGLGSASETAGSGMSGLHKSTGDVATSISALSGSLSATVGGFVALQQEHTDIIQQQDAIERNNTAQRKAYDTLISTIDKYGGSNQSASKDVKAVSDAQGVLHTANEKVSKDQQTIQDDERKLASLRAAGKAGTDEYIKTQEKLQRDIQTYHDDADKAAQKQGDLNDATTKFNTDAAPAFDLGASKIIAAQQHYQDTVATGKRLQEEYNRTLTTQWLTTAQTVLGSMGSIAGVVGTFSKLFQETTKTTDEFGKSATTIGTNWGKLIGTGGVLGLAAIAIYAISTNMFGVRTGMEQWWAKISEGNPLLKGFGELIHGIAADLGMTGTGVMSGQDEISKAIRDIHTALQQTNIGQDLINLQQAFVNFLQNPFGSAETITGITNKPDVFYAPGINKMITSVGPNAAYQTSSNAKILGDAILKTIVAAGEWVVQNLPKAITKVGDAIISAIEPTKNAIEALGEYIIGGISDYFSGKPAADKGRDALINLLTNMITGVDIGQAAQTAIGNIGLALIKSLFKVDLTPEGTKKYADIIKNLVSALFDPKTWATFDVDVVKALEAAFIGTGTTVGGITRDVVTKIFTPLFDAKNWVDLGTKAIGALESLFMSATGAVGGGGAGGISKDVVTKIFTPLFDAKNWVDLGTKAISALESVFASVAGSAGTAAGITKDVVTKIFTPLFTASNWAGLGTKAIDALTSLFVAAGGAAGGAAGITKDVVNKIFTPLFTVSNWAGLGKAAQDAMVSVLKITQIYDIISPLFNVSNWTKLISDAQAAITKALTIKQIYDIVKPLFDYSNWSKLAQDAQDAINKALTVSGDKVYDILKALGDQNNWSKVGQMIVDALKNFLIKGVQQALQSIASTLSSLPQQIGQGAAGVASALYNAGAALGKLITGATLPSGAVAVNTPGGRITTNAVTAGAGGTLTINLNVSGKTLAQVVAPYNVPTSQFS